MKRISKVLDTLSCIKNQQKSKRNFLSVRDVYPNSKAGGSLERVEDDDTRDHQKAANLVMRSEICVWGRKFHKWSNLMENAVFLETI